MPSDRRSRIVSDCGDGIRVVGAVISLDAVARLPSLGVANPERVPATRMGAVDLGIARPRISGGVVRSTKDRRTCVSILVMLTTLTLTRPTPKRRWGTTVQTRQGSM